jgi:hypothetical protein
MIHLAAKSPHSGFGHLLAHPRGKKLSNDDETPETALWRETVERLLASGSSAAEALDGATLIVQAYRRQSSVPVEPSIDPQNPLRASGVRRKIKSGNYKAK